MSGLVVYASMLFKCAWQHLRPQERMQSFSFPAIVVHSMIRVCDLGFRFKSLGKFRASGFQGLGWRSLAEMSNTSLQPASRLERESDTANAPSGKGEEASSFLPWCKPVNYREARPRRVKAI